MSYPVDMRTLCFSGALALGSLSLWLTFSGCCYFNGSCKQQVDACLQPAIRESATDAFGLVVDVLEHGTGDLDKELEGLALALGGHGLDVVTCIVKTFTSQKPAALSPEVARGIQRGQDWLKRHGGA